MTLESILNTIKIILPDLKHTAESILNTIKIILPGLQYTIGLFAVTIILSIPLGLLMAFVMHGKSKILKFILRFYVLIMRGTPLMLQLFFIYFGLPKLPGIGKFLVMDRFPAACVAFVLNYAAYFCEIFRGGLLSVEKGQYEAAKVLGFTKTQTMLRVVIPQMFRVVLPPVSNETITLVKDTSLVTAISLSDLMNLTKALVTSTSNVFPFFIAALFYLVMTYALTKLFNYLEHKFAY
ncbi:MAG: amino acid ABC transporter permease [Oscillospiraceae bacterium]|nr:amino acid ABC transporter permease [Oscillospiraceae bacterium]